MKHNIYVITDEKKLIAMLKDVFEKDEDYNFINSSSDEIDNVLREIPSLIIIDEDGLNVDIIKLCNKVKNDENNAITPVIVVSSNTSQKHAVELLQQMIQYYLIKPINSEYLYYTIKNIIELLYTNRKMSPLTGLPGNVQIQAEMKKRLLKNEVFAIMYIDLDNFKAYNDVYGFSCGDEIIKFTAKVISKNVHRIEKNESFIGHIGGDDFIAIVDKTNYDNICQEIIMNFDDGIQNFYTKNDVINGFVEIENRRGIIERFPLTTISIAIVEVDTNMFNSTLEIAEVGAQVKHRAKKILGSSYVINRRK